MNIYLSKKIAKAIGMNRFTEFGVDETTWGWKDLHEINLSGYTVHQCQILFDLLTAHKDVRGTGVLIKDIKNWIAATKDVSTVKPRTVEQFFDLVLAMIGSLPRHHLFRKFGEDQWLCYYVTRVEYHPEHKTRDQIYPAFCSVDMAYEEFGGRKSKRLSFFEEDCRNMSILEALARQDYVPETDEMRTTYLKDLALFRQTIPHIGKQYLCVGTGTDDLDGNTSRSNSWYYSRTNVHQMVRDEQPTRVVIDVFAEDHKTDKNDDRVHLDTWFWPSRMGRVKTSVSFMRKGYDGKLAKETTELDTKDLDAMEEAPEIEVPVHPMCAVFDLAKHTRLRVHVNFLTLYEYDASVADKLIIPDDLRSLIHMLIQHKDGGLKDIIKGKSGGAVVLLAGKPGVGKTLTAEVFAESEGRALYSIQCSQLGTDANELEDNLLKVFARAKRWNAVTLLDEADVYVKSRGEDLEQNAIVGVFLRTLEYQQSILFLTTNRPESVDDAIASRCIARISYPTLSSDDQAKVWRVLTDVAGVSISDKTINDIVANSPNISGRDVKNLMKLAALLKPGEPISVESVEFVKRFKPTN